MKRNGKETTLNDELWDAAAGWLLLAEFIRVITRSHLVVWTRTDDDGDLGFSAALDTGIQREDDDHRRAAEIVVFPSMVVRGGKGFVAEAEVTWYGEDDALLDAMQADIDDELYAEVEESWRASGSKHMQVAVIRRGAALTMRPYGPADEEGYLQ
jgi:hypothetical protein